MAHPKLGFTFASLMPLGPSLALETAQQASSLGFRSFSDFLRSRAGVVELEESGHERLVRLADQ